MIAHSSQTLINLLLKGGWLMIPLLLLSIISVYIIVDRLLIYNKCLPEANNNSLKEIEEQLNHSNLEYVKRICEPQNNIVQQVLYKGLEQRKISNQNITLLLENESNKSLAYLEENLSLLATIAGAAPMIGFLGTVTGMIQTFMAIAHTSSHHSTHALSSGIYEAMVTTVVGLVVGIIAYLGYNYCTNRINKAAQQLSYLITLFIIRIK